ncbi:hypothetical protein ACSNOK_08500 [Streptomyces sp. URMC 126]|uniref:hypothetical protein n=1 Tax=Streptomyces sp. URMC 126 TaxID=3423401 RepID=UPI003F199770
MNLSADGLPERITVASDWQVRLRADGVGTAVVEAYEAALKKRMELWERSLADSDRERRAARLDESFPTPDTAPPSAGGNVSGARSTFAGPAGDVVARQRVDPAGLAFYVTLGLILYKFITATVAGIAAAATVVFSWAGLAGIVAAAGVDAALVTGAVGPLVAALAIQAQQLVVVKGEVEDNRAFPGGKWPVATA